MQRAKIALGKWRPVSGSRSPAPRWRCGRCLAGAALGVLALGGCAATEPKRPPVQYESTAWKFGKVAGHKLTTGHYEIYTTLSDDVLVKALPEFVEGAFAYYQRLLPPTRTPPERMSTYLFASRGQWEAFTRRFTGSRAKVFLKVRNGGYTERGVVAIEYVAHQTTFPIFAHEGLHQYLHHYVNNTTVPAWLNEGLAVLCEGQRWDIRGLKEFDPWYNPSRRNTLAQALLINRLHSLRKLLATNAGEVMNTSTDSVGTYYAQLWALMLFLREGAGGKHATDFQRLLAALGKPEFAQYARAAYISSDQAAFNLGEEVFRGFISPDIDTVEHEYFAFMREKFVGPK